MARIFKFGTSVLSLASSTRLRGWLAQTSSTRLPGRLAQTSSTRLQGWIAETETSGVKNQTSVVSPNTHWTTRLHALIQEIEPLGSFVHTERLTNVPQLLPHVTVDGVGRLGFPMMDLVVQQLIANSEKAPYGKLDQTLMDTNVRDAWQIDANKITIGGGDTWKTYFHQLVRQQCFHLGISYERFDNLGIQANLYKLLIYEKDGHFLTHRDTEKEPHMFGTLLIQLPTSDGFQGGELTVSHRGDTKRFNLSVDSDNEFHAVSFYADCEHELHPITAGNRVCLVYNLLATSPEKDTSTTILSPDVSITTENTLRLICADWSDGDLEKITKIGYQLEHEYTHQSIGYSTLKGRDEIVVAALRNARTDQGRRLFRVSILLMQHHFEKDYLGEYFEDDVRPFVLIEETADGLWERKGGEDAEFPGEDAEFPNQSDWDMVCHSKGGWWVMPSVVLENVISEYTAPSKGDEVSYSNLEATNDGKDNEEEEEEDCYSDEDNEDKIPYDRKMFLSTCDVILKENAYNGNDGGSHETFYYAAAVIFCPSINIPSQK